MGGSKPSQFWQKEPAATDRKWRAEDEGLLEREKHELASKGTEDGELNPAPRGSRRKRAQSQPKGKKRAGKRGKSGR
jgi:hypothetical protein